MIQKYNYHNYIWCDHDHFLLTLLIFIEHMFRALCDACYFVCWKLEHMFEHTRACDVPEQSKGLVLEFIFGCFRANL